MAETLRRSTRHVQKPKRLLDEQLFEQDVQDFYYKDDPSDLEEEDFGTLILLHSRIFEISAIY